MRSFYEPPDYYLGLDLGQSHDFSAIAIVEEPLWIIEGRVFDRTGLTPEGANGWVSPNEHVRSVVRHWRRRNRDQGRPPSPPLHLRYLQRLRHVSYQRVVNRVRELLQTPPLCEADVALVVDHTGVGRAVLDMLLVAGLDPLGITITGGNEVHGSPAERSMNVPKRDLITSTQAALQNGRLKIAPELEHAQTLIAELKDYRVKISAAGHDSYNAREGQHDDLVLAVSLACWYRDWLNHNYDQMMAAAMRRGVNNYVF